MDANNSKLTYLSPLISKNTPIKRLGLSRKRKSPSVENQSNKILMKNAGDSPLTSSSSTKHQEEENIISENLKKSSPNDDSVEALKKRIEEKEKILKSLKESTSNSDIKELEDLYQLWKNGCKNALTRLLTLINNNHPELNTIEKLSEKLGIHEIVQDNFQDDVDFLTYEI